MMRCLYFCKFSRSTTSIAVFRLQNLKCLLVIFADQIFVDPTFFSMFVCGPLQSFTVNVCTFLRRFFSYFHELLHIKIFSVKKNNQYSSLQLRHAARRLNENSTDFVFQSFRKRIKANSLISTAYLTSIHPTVQIFNARSPDTNIQILKTAHNSQRS